MTKLTAKERHNRKRAARIEAAGVRVDNLLDADTAFVGHNDDGTSTCALCDHAIKWLFRLSLNTESGWAEFEPVGSTCITDWVEALPISSAQSELITRLKLAKGEAAKLKAETRARNALLKQLNEDEAKAVREYWAAPKHVREDDTLTDIIFRVEKYRRFASVKQFGFFAGRLQRLLKGSARIQAETKTAEAPKVTQSDEVAALLERGRDVFRTGKAKLLDDRDREALEDIGKRVANYGTFVSDRQRSFFQAILRRADEAKAACKHENTTTDGRNGTEWCNDCSENSHAPEHRTSLEERIPDAGRITRERRDRIEDNHYEDNIAAYDAHAEADYDDLPL